MDTLTLNLTTQENIMESNMKTNINGISYDLNDGGDMCHVCDQHLHNCKPHTEQELFDES